MQVTVVHTHKESLGWKDIKLHGQGSDPSEEHLPPAGSNMCILSAMNDTQMELLMKSIFERYVLIGVGVASPPMCHVRT